LGSFLRFFQRRNASTPMVMLAMATPAPMPALAPVLRPVLLPGDAAMAGAVEVEAAAAPVAETLLALTPGSLAELTLSEASGVLDVLGEELRARAILVVVVDVTVTAARKTLVYVLRTVVVVSHVDVERYVEVE
jgi:hypothetical protein